MEFKKGQELFNQLQDEVADLSLGTLALAVRGDVASVMITGPGEIEGETLAGILDTFILDGYDTEVLALSSGELGIVVS